VYLKKSFIIINLILGIQYLAYADWINQAAMKVEPHTIQLRHYIHANPELGNLKFKTSELVQKELNAYGAEVKKGFAKTDVIGVLKEGRSGPVIALRADMDVLPMQKKLRFLLPVRPQGYMRVK